MRPSRGITWHEDVASSQWVKNSSHLIYGEVERPQLMNKYGAMAQKHWQTWLPTRYQALPDPEVFFAELGEQVAQEILDRVSALEASQAERLRAMSYLERVGALNAMQMQIEETVLMESVFLTPEPQTQEPEIAATPRWTRNAQMDDEGMPLNRDHPLWRMLEDDDVSREQFQIRYRAWLEQHPTT